MDDGEVGVAAAEALDCLLCLNLQDLDDELRVCAPQVTHRRGHER